MFVSYAVPAPIARTLMCNLRASLATPQVFDYIYVSSEAVPAPTGNFYRPVKAARCSFSQ
jgi:hypothetical protein